MKNIPLECGKVKGIAYAVSAKSGNRIIYYCDTCQVFARHLEKNVLDENDGTDIFQMSYTNIEITEGIEYVRSLKLTNKGLTRWYTTCCKTPIGNTVSGKLTFMDNTGSRERDLGPVLAHSYIKKDSPAYHLNT